ncbi:MAG: multicopper oxidase domain-containing protein, partial [Planctomycetota bacterium]
MFLPVIVSSLILQQPTDCFSQTLLDAGTLTKYVDPLFNPMQNVLQPTGTLDGAPLYEVGVSQFQHQMHRDLPATTVWGYNNAFPGPTFDIQRDTEIKVRWTNNLVDGGGSPLQQHLLPYDTTIHGAGPMFPQARAITHVHGAVTDEASDGFPEHWVSADPAAPANGLGGPAGNSLVATYTNNQRAAANWYHDHSMGITRLNVYAGMAGFYLLRDGEEQALGLPSGDYEIPLMFQDRSFYDDGQLFYPRGPGDLFSPGVGDPLQGLPPEFPSDVSQVASYLADANLVNGTVWPYLEVEPRKYRFQMLNGANSRFYEMALEPQAGAANMDPVTFHQIGTDSGLLTDRVERSSVNLAPADRADVIVDFSEFNPGDTILMRNTDPTGRAGTTDQVMEFRIKAPTDPDDSLLPDSLSTIDRYDPQDAIRTRRLELVRTLDQYGRRELLLDGLKWTDANTETVIQGELEIWEFVNMTCSAHPMHLHMEAFQLLDRSTSSGQPIPLEAHELGWEDTVTVGPWESARIMVKFDQYTGTFVWHCHILEHEDLEMMRTFRIVADGDFNDDGIFDCTDINALTSGIAAGTTDLLFDLTGDGVVDLADRDEWLAAA